MSAIRYPVTPFPNNGITRNFGLVTTNHSTARVGDYKLWVSPSVHQLKMANHSTPCVWCQRAKHDKKCWQYSTTNVFWSHGQSWDLLCLKLEILTFGWASCAHVKFET